MVLGPTREKSMLPLMLPAQVALVPLLTRVAVPAAPLMTVPPDPGIETPVLLKAPAYWALPFRSRVAPLLTVSAVPGKRVLLPKASVVTPALSVVVPV